MRKRNFVEVFVVLFVLSLIIFFASTTGILKPVESLFGGVLSPLQSITTGAFSKLTDFGSTAEVKVLKQQNLVLTQKLVDQTRLIGDNKALNDQFQTQTPRSQSLLPADIVAAPEFIPGISVPETLILNQGEADGVKVGQAVLYQNNLIGKIVKTSAFLSSVKLVTNASFSFTAKTLGTQGLGVINGQGGGEMILGNVVLSDTLKKQDTVLTKGDVNLAGLGLPPDLVVGKITSVSKSPSDLFQKAEVKSLIDVSKLTKVFILTNYQ
jgi:rod shape-determining protein MreC